MSWPLIFFVVLLVATLGSYPVANSRGWGFMPTAVLVLLTVLVGFKAFNVI